MIHCTQFRIHIISATRQQQKLCFVDESCVRLSFLFRALNLYVKMKMGAGDAILRTLVTCGQNDSMHSHQIQSL